MWLTCLQCGQTYFGSGKFCTSKCEEYFLHPPVYVKEVTKKCHWCGKASDKAFCSDECRNENSRSGTVTCKCQYCGKTFIGTYKIKYCSDVCRKAGFARSQRKPDKCIVCFGPMPADYVGTCSKECQIAFNDRT